MHDNAHQIPAWIDGKLQPADKLDVHLAGHKHKAVSVFVVCGTDVLLQRRALSKYHTPGLWANTCCTHPHWSESPIKCAVRRLEEELGLTGLVPQHRHQLEYRADVGGGMIEHEVVDVYLSLTRWRPDLTPNPDEVIDTRWIDYHDLLAEIARHPERFTPWLQIYLADYSDVIFGPDVAIRGLR